jgi:hypothetical protein
VPVGGEEQPAVQALLAGQSEESVLGALLGSTALTSTSGFRGQEVVLDYNRLLQRQPSQSEVNNWVFTSLSIQSIRELLEVSDEFYFNGT